MNYVMKNELYHHGILGQKWGITNGPPYPLDPEDHSENEQKLQDLKSRFKSSKALYKYTRQLRNGEEQKAKAKMKSDRDEYRQAKKAVRTVEREERKAVKAQKEEEKFQKHKAKILRAGDIKRANQISEKLTNEEIDAVIARYNQRHKLDNLVEKETEGQKFVQQLQKQQAAQVIQNNQPNQNQKQPKKNTVDKLTDTVNKAKKVADAASTGIGTYNTVAKIINAVGGTKLPTVDLDPKKDVKEHFVSKEYKDDTLVKETVKSQNKTTGETEMSIRTFTDNYANVDYQDMLNSGNRLGSDTKFNDLSTEEQIAKLKKKNNRYQ